MSPGGGGAEKNDAIFFLSEKGKHRERRVREKGRKRKAFC